jgi:hypothetical protein
LEKPSRFLIHLNRSHVSSCQIPQQSHQHKCCELLATIYAQR